MPSDTATPTASTVVMDALDALGPSRDAFRSSVVTAAEELRGMLARARAAGGDRAQALATELGPFATGRVDTADLAGVLGDGAAVDDAALAALEAARDVLDELGAAADADPEAVPFVAEVPEGGDLRDTVQDALTRAGRAFGASRAADLARTGRYRASEHAGLLEGLAPRRWTPGERGVAPPLVVRVRGGDLRPAGLADVLGGGQRLVLVVEGSHTPPAALARLITPHILVLQALDASGLESLAEHEGTAVAALFTDAGDAVPFLHHPRGGALPWERIALEEDAPVIRNRMAKARWKETSWKEDLEHLLALATAPAGPASSGPSGSGQAESEGDRAQEGDASPGDTSPGDTSPGDTSPGDASRLAAWLLARTDLEDV